MEGSCQVIKFFNILFLIAFALFVIIVHQAVHKQEIQKDVAQSGYTYVTICESADSTNSRRTYTIPNDMIGKGIVIVIGDCNK